MVLDVVQAADLLIEVEDGQDAVEVLLYAVLHISLAYADCQPLRSQPVLSRLPAAMLRWSSANRLDQVVLGLQVLATLSVRTRQYPEGVAIRDLALLPVVLRDAYWIAVAASSADDTWLPGSEDRDPWRYMQRREADGAVRQRQA
jgi:hypothetical protein